MNEEFPKSDRGNLAPVAVRNVRLRDFRNYASLDLQLGEGLNILYGQNAQGKTNVLEACYLLATTRLLRGSREGEGVRLGAPFAELSLTLDPFGTELSMKLEAGRRKLARLNGMNLPRAADLIGRLPCVCFSAGDMEIVRGSPEDRRLFLDLELSQLSPAYLHHLTHYKRALDQRNALLRRAQDHAVGPDEFEIWEATLAEHGHAIRTMRMELVHELRPLATGFYAALAPSEALDIRYEPKDPWDGVTDLKEALGAARARDIARGSGSVGPHRDDLFISVDAKDARYFGSQGQQRTAVLASKLAAHRRQRDVIGSPPLLLLDDILSDLDEGRRARLVEWISSEARQAILTCTEPEAAGTKLVERANLFEVVAGTIRPQ